MSKQMQNIKLREIYLKCHRHKTKLAGILNTALKKNSKTILETKIQKCKTFSACVNHFFFIIAITITVIPHPRFYNYYPYQDQYLCPRVDITWSV